MRRPVNLDDQSSVEGGEIGDEAAKDGLASETEAGHLLTPKSLPKAPFGARGVPSEAASERPQCFPQGATPHPDPPPQGGREWTRPDIQPRERHGIAWKRFASALIRFAVSMSRSVIFIPASWVQNENETML